MSEEAGITVVEEFALDKNARDLFRKADKAIGQKNFDYAIKLLQSVVKQTPGFLDGRKKLRIAAVLKARTEKKGGLFGGKGGGGLGLMKIKSRGEEGATSNAPGAGGIPRGRSA